MNGLIVYICKGNELKNTINRAFHSSATKESDIDIIPVLTYY